MHDDLLSGAGAETRRSRTFRYSGWPETGQPLFGAIEQARVLQKIRPALRRPSV